jgi:hypothetical protein
MILAEGYRRQDSLRYKILPFLCLAFVTKFCRTCVAPSLQNSAILVSRLRYKILPYLCRAFVTKFCRTCVSPSLQNSAVLVSRLPYKILPYLCRAFFTNSAVLVSRLRYEILPYLYRVSDHAVLTYLFFATVSRLTEQGRQPCVENQAPVLLFMLRALLSSLLPRHCP